VVQVGLKQVAKLTTMPIEAGSQLGTAIGKTKRVTNVVVRFENTLGGQLGIDNPPEGNSQFDSVEVRAPSNMMNDALPVISGFFPYGQYKFLWPAGYEQEAKLTYRNEQPFPVTIIGIYPDVTTAD
jgi:hypothetical protein